ncbi:MAG: DUF3460 family protein [Burkholderiaceae bacterium]
MSKLPELYTSEATQFLNALKAERPHLERSQKEGRALLWDKAPIAPEQSERWKASRVAQKGYPYQTGS